jgi:hypothetical protein
LSARASNLRAQTGAAYGIRVAKNAPAGKHDVELLLELTNFHVAPEKNLVVSVPLTIEVAAN